MHKIAYLVPASGSHAANPVGAVCTGVNQPVSNSFRVLEDMIMSEHRILSGSIRKVWPSDSDKFRDHLLRLDKGSRRMRFAHGVSDSFIEDYARRMGDMGSIVYAYIEGGEIRGAAELRKLSDVWGQEAEAAFSIELDYQNQGLGTELMGRVIRAGRNRGVQRLYMSCLAENSKMQKIARKHEADLRFEYGEVIGEIVPDGANYFSLLQEAVEDRVGHLMAVFDLQTRLSKAA
jgi:RimJ/RimL family protein N-acetyltransferase